MKLSHFSIAFFLVSGPIQSSFSRRALSEVRRLSTSLVISALDSGGKYCLTYSWPSASPTPPSVVSSTRFQRGFCSCWPRSVLPKKSKRSSANLSDRYGAMPSIVCARKYACHCAAGTSVIILLNSAKNFGCDSEKPSTFTPCALRNSDHGKFGEALSASATETKWYWLFGSRCSIGDSDALARRVSSASTSLACLSASAAATPAFCSCLLTWAT